MHRIVQTVSTAKPSVIVYIAPRWEMTRVIKRCGNPPIGPTESKTTVTSKAMHTTSSKQSRRSSRPPWMLRGITYVMSSSVFPRRSRPSFTPTPSCTAEWLVHPASVGIYWPASATWIDSKNAGWSGASASASPRRTGCARRRIRSTGRGPIPTPADRCRLECDRRRILCAICSPAEIYRRCEADCKRDRRSNRVVVIE